MERRSSNSLTTSGKTEDPRGNPIRQTRTRWYAPTNETESDTAPGWSATRKLSRNGLLGNDDWTSGTSVEPLRCYLRVSSFCNSSGHAVGTINRELHTSCEQSIPTRRTSLRGFETAHCPACALV